MANPEAMALLKIARRDLTAAALLQDPAADEANWGFQIQQVVEQALNLDRPFWQQQAEPLVEHVAAICAALP